jgi:hypothetical protein
MHCYDSRQDIPLKRSFSACEEATEEAQTFNLPPPILERRSQRDAEASISDSKSPEPASIASHSSIESNSPSLQDPKPCEEARADSAEAPPDVSVESIIPAIVLQTPDNGSTPAKGEVSRPDSPGTDHQRPATDTGAAVNAKESFGDASQAIGPIVSVEAKSKAVDPISDQRKARLPGPEQYLPDATMPVPASKSQQSEPHKTDTATAIADAISAAAAATAGVQRYYLCSPLICEP